MPDTLMAEGKRVLGFFALDAGSIGADNRSRIELFPGVGKYVHPVSGKFEITQADLDAWVADINERGDKISIDFDHSFAHGKGSEAAGWFVAGSAALEDGKVYAEIEWTPEGAAAIQAKKYRFISPEFAFKFKDMAGKVVDKPRLWAAALTNRPFFDQMQPVTVCDEGLADILSTGTPLLDASDIELLTRVADEGNRALLMSALQGVDPAIAIKTRAYLTSLPEPTEEDEVDLSELGKTLDLPAGASNEEILAAASKAASAHVSLKKRLAERKPANRTRKDNEMDLTVIAAELGLSDDADDATVIAALREARSAIDRHELDGEELDRLRADSKEKDALEDRVKVIEAERRNDKIKRMLEDGVRKGKVIPAEKAVLQKQFSMNPDALFELLAARPEHVFRLTAKGSDAGELDSSLYGVADEFASKEADGGIDPESAKMHLQALHVLAEQGKGTNYTEAEYVQALSIVTS